MSVKAMEESIKAVTGIVADQHAVGTITGSGIDTMSYDEALIVVNAGTFSASSTADIKVQHSSDNSSFADITGALFVTITTANDVTSYVGRLSTKNFKQYIRVILVVGVDVVDLGATVLLGKFDGLAPVAQTNAVAFAITSV